MSRWLRRNRWGLVGLPLAAVLLVAGNSQRVEDWWWKVDFHRPPVTSAEQGDWVAYTEDFSDGLGKGERALRFRVTEVKRIDSYTDRWGNTTKIGNPAYDAWRVHIDAKAEPQSVLVECSMALTEDDGTRYEWDQNADDIAQDQGYACLPADAWGPMLASEGDKERELGLGTPRPAAWSVDPVFFVPKGAKITGLMLWWSPPHYARIKVHPG